MTTRAKRTYLVAAATGYRGHKQGDRVELALTDDEERRAIERGSLRHVKAKKEEEQDA